MHGKSGLMRGGAAVLGAAVALLTAAPLASADPVSAMSTGEAKGRVEGGDAAFQVNFDRGPVNTPVAELFNLTLSDGSKLKVYCVQVDVDLDKQQDMIERPWDKFPDAASPFHKNRDKLNWVLHHGYPANDLAAIEAELAKKDVKFHDKLSKAEAITATQAAVWHFSDDRNLNPEHPIRSGSADDAADVLALYKYLTGDANTGIGEQPKPTLNISAKATEGKAGTRIGPFTVTTTGDITELTSKLPEGVKITDADGKELKTADVKDGSELYVDVPKDSKDGNGTFALKASGHLDTGRLFVGENYEKKKAQSLIVAQSEKTTVSANAAAKWTAGTVTPPTSETSTPPSATTAPPTPSGPPTTAPSVVPQAEQGSLPYTGVSAILPISIGALLLIGGTVMLLLVRRRRKSAA
ncbi:thioester domain-containing protein [Amycolatopsis sp. NPDC059021]|uniref:thioester domain-containing protein n=1 Tax=Amycolatopsis sp. NPDC059021 TaxID=3346704 RepID=UPI00366B0930